MWGVLALLSSPAAQWLVRESPASGAVVTAQIAQARDSVLEAQVRAVASELRCPVCQGESIQDSPAALAQEMRAVVHEQLAAGRTPDDVKRFFADKYGEWILLRPKARGWNVMVYVLPVLALLVGAAVVMRATRRWATPSDVAAAAESERARAET